MSIDDNDRRPLASRDTNWARTIAANLVALSIAPNRISQASMAAAAAAGGAFMLAGYGSGTPRAIMLILAALFCQLRLLCNLFDGMVAVEGGKGEDDGPFWNEFPDRVSDVLILVGAGFCIGSPSLGWAAAAFAILTAYVRELGRANALSSDFSGPMAKQHRMAVITAAALLSVLEPLWNGRDEVLAIALWVIVLGAALTALHRGRNIVLSLRDTEE
jgi:phosphatidylglycerophosphate synthase